MASIKKLSDRKFKITVSNGYRPSGKKICKAKTITVPDSVKPRGIPQYVAHEAEELDRLVQSGYSEDRDTTFEPYATRKRAKGRTSVLRLANRTPAGLALQKRP